MHLQRFSSPDPDAVKTMGLRQTQQSIILMDSFMVTPSPLAYIKQTGNAESVRQGNFCRTSGTISCISASRPGPCRKRPYVLDCERDLLHFFLTHWILLPISFQTPFFRFPRVRSTRNLRTAMTRADNHHRYSKSDPVVKAIRDQITRSTTRPQKTWSTV